MSKQTKDGAPEASGVLVHGVPVEEIPELLVRLGAAEVDVDLAAAGHDHTVETTFRGTEIVDMKVLPRNPDKCIVVRPDFDRQRAYCTVDEGSHQIEDPFRVNGRITDEEKAAAGDDSAALLTIFAERIAGVVATEAKQRDIEVARVANSEAGKATAEALRKAGFVVIEFGE